MIRTSESTMKILAALAAAQGELRTVVRDGMAEVVSKRTGGVYRYTYATLAQVIEMVRPVLAAHHLALLHGVRVEGQNVGVSTRIAHESGEWCETEIAATAENVTPQAIWSVVSYLRRYGVSALLSLATEDDDGEAGEGKAPTATQHGRPSGVAVPTPRLVTTPPDAPASPRSVPAAKAVQFPAQAGDNKITDAQAKRFYAITKKSLAAVGIGDPERDAVVHDWIRALAGVEHVHDLTWRQYKALLPEDGTPFGLLPDSAARRGSSPAGTSPRAAPPRADDPPPPEDVDVPF